MLLSKARLPVTNITVTERTVNILVYWKNKFSMSYIGLSVHDIANNNAFAGVPTVADVPAAASCLLVLLASAGAGAVAFLSLPLLLPPSAYLCYWPTCWGWLPCCCCA
jgi:hypothetical protein